MRRSFVCFFVLFLLASAALAQAPGQFTVTVTKDQETVQPRANTRLTVTVTNNGPEFSGSVQGSIVIPAANGGGIVSATSSNPLVTCNRTATTPNEVFICFCNPVTIPAGGSITFTVDVTAPNLNPGAVTNFGGIFVIGNSAPISYSTQIVIASGNAPRLTISVKRNPQLPDLVDNYLVVYYETVVTNVGTAPTTGEIVIDLNFRVPENKRPELTPNVPLGSGTWVLRQPQPEKRQLVSLDVLQPGATIKLPMTATFESVLRGVYTYSATVTGGGSSPAASNFDDLVNIDLRSGVTPFLPAPPSGVNGRPR
jgi:hypothetical protein